MQTDVDPHSPAAGPARAAAQALAAELQIERPLVFLDLEATGLDVAVDRIVEISCIRVEPGGTLTEFESRVDPGVAIPAEATAVHGISADDLADAPTFASLGPQIERFLAGADLAGYNHGRYDLPMLEYEFARAGVDFDWRARGIVDVSVIFRRMEPRSLTGAMKFYCDKDLESAHAARADVVATMEVLAGQLKRYSQLSRDVAELDVFTRPRSVPRP
jgi:DNA polymerase-3 subunit epsilon